MTAKKKTAAYQVKREKRIPVGRPASGHKPELCVDDIDDLNDAMESIHAFDSLLYRSQEESIMAVSRILSPLVERLDEVGERINTKWDLAASKGGGK